MVLERPTRKEVVLNDNERIFLLVLEITDRSSLDPQHACVLTCETLGKLGKEIKLANLFD